MLLFFIFKIKLMVRIIRLANKTNGLEELEKNMVRLSLHTMANISVLKNVKAKAIVSQL